MATGLSVLAFSPATAVVAPATVESSSTAGQWTAPFTPAGPANSVIGVHSILLHTGEVLILGELRPTHGYLYDPVTGQTRRADPPAEVECGGMVQLQDGRLLFVGGHGKGPTGIDNVSLFDPVTATWTAQPADPPGRYYPTTTLLPDGRVLINGGFTSTGADNPTVEVYTPPAAGSSKGTLETVAQHAGGLYPDMWVLPNGKVLEVGRKNWLIDPATWTWTPLSPTKFKHYSGEASALLPSGPGGSDTAMIIGGGNNTSAVTSVESYNVSTGTWSARAPLPEPRAHMHAVLMPDGTVLGVGGNSKGNFELPQYTALSYDPQADTWTHLAAQAERRGYHSTAVLLPDGRVLSAGDTGVGGGGKTLEIFSPPYLFQGARPTIDSAPSQVAHGGTFTINTADTASKAVLMAPASTTHTVDFNQREVTLQTSTASGGISAVAPSGTVAPTGWYMLFLVNGGVPSTASWVHIG